jgi:hypothetical protein
MSRILNMQYPQNHLNLSRWMHNLLLGYIDHHCQGSCSANIGMEAQHSYRVVHRHILNIGVDCKGLGVSIPKLYIDILYSLRFTIGHDLIDDILQTC